MHHITKPITSLTIIAALITPTFGTHQDYTYQDVGLSRPLKVYNNIAIEPHKLENIVHDMSMMKSFLDERKNRMFFPFHTKHPLLIQGYLRGFGIRNIPQDIILVINTHIPNHRIQRQTCFFLSDSIMDLVYTIVNIFEQADDYNQSDEDGDVDMYDNIHHNEEEKFVLLSEKNPEAFKQVYAAYCTLKEFFIAYDDEKKDYKKGFDYGLRCDAMIECEIQSRKDLAQRDRAKQILSIHFIGLNELSGNTTWLLNFLKYSSTLQDIIDVINFANGAKAHNLSEIQQYYNKDNKEFLEDLESVPKTMNKNWSIIPDDINFYNQCDSFGNNIEYRLLDPDKPVALRSNDVSAYEHTNGGTYFRIYFSAIPLIKHLWGGNH